MGRKRQYRRPLSPQEEEELSRFFSDGIGFLAKRQKGLLSLLEEEGPERFTWLLANILSDNERARGFTPDQRFYPNLREKLDHLRKSGWPTDDLKVSRVDKGTDLPKLRIELSLIADVKEYLPAIEAYQEFFTSSRDPSSFPSYILSKYEDPYVEVTIAEIVEEVNAGITNWAQGRSTHLNMFGLDDYLRAKGYTPHELRDDEGKLDAALFDEDKMRRLIKYHRTKK